MFDIGKSMYREKQMKTDNSTTKAMLSILKTCTETSPGLTDITATGLFQGEVLNMKAKPFKACPKPCRSTSSSAGMEKDQR